MKLKELDLKQLKFVRSELKYGSIVNVSYEDSPFTFQIPKGTIVFIENETLLENLNNRNIRPFKTYREEVVPMVMEHVKRYESPTYKLVKESKWSWSKHCGCSMCPCSPGFISDIKDHENHRTLFVTIK